MVDEIAAPDLPAWLDRDAYPFRLRRARVPDGALAFVDEGAGPPVLFAHGTPTWSFEWRHLVRALAPAHRCLAPDHLGFGLSERPDGADYTPEAHAERFAAFADLLDLREVTLVVHDFGGPIALPWALANRARMRALVVLDSWMWSFADDPLMRRRGQLAGGRFGRWLYRWANASLRLLMPSVYGDRAKLTRAIHGQYLAPFASRKARGDVLWPLARALNGSAAHYDRLWRARAALADLPTLVLWGRRDGAFRPAMLERWRAVAPSARIVELPDAGHWPHEEEPERVAHEVRAFLAATASSTGIRAAAL
ncbi:MAG: alpha/beta fold hydrolase [Kofleriaceae bacterium]|nr:MAG: alpha/beta fold hydrolase [Kofleriaceae bacterium]